MTTNSFYSARLPDADRRYFCDEQPAAIRREGLAADTAYVFGPHHPPPAVDLGDHDCRPVDGAILCAREAGRRGLDPGLAPAQ